MIGLTGMLAELLPREPEALALAALVRFAERGGRRGCGPTGRWCRFPSRTRRCGGAN
jgi:predicted RNA polymerase sigma factor